MTGFLTFGIWFVIGLGILLLLIHLGLIFFGQGKLKFEGMHIFDIWMIVLGIVMANILFHSPLIQYDNFSHWAVIVKFLNFTGHLPGPTDSIISFTSYPPATALFMAEFVKLVGFSDGTMLVGQFIIIWAASYAVFAVLRDHSRALTSLLLCFIIAIVNVFNIAIRFNNLLVDYVLPILTVAGIAGLYIHQKQPKIQWATFILFSSTLLLVKNSGAFFVAVLAFYYLYLLMKVHGHGFKKVMQQFGIFVSGVGLALTPFLWWSQHVKIFALSKHEISAQAYKQQLASESFTVIMRIVKKFVDQLFSLDTLSFQGILLINATLIIAWLIIGAIDSERNPLFKVTIIVDVLYVLYSASVLGMYLVSMPYAEAINLDGFDRYTSSVIILDIFIMGMALVYSIDKAFHEQRFEKRDLRAFSSIFTKNVYQMSSFLLLIFSIIMMYSESNGIKFTNYYSRAELPLQLARISNQRMALNDKRVLLVDPHADDVGSYYAGYVGRYYYFTNELVAQENFMMSRKQFKKTVNKYDYVVIPEFHSTFSAMTRQVYHEHVRVGMFKVTQDKLVKIR